MVPVGSPVGNFFVIRRKSEISLIYVSYNNLSMRSTEIDINEEVVTTELAKTLCKMAL